MLNEAVPSFLTVTVCVLACVPQFAYPFSPNETAAGETVADPLVPSPENEIALGRGAHIVPVVWVEDNETVPDIFPEAVGLNVAKIEFEPPPARLNDDGDRATVPSLDAITALAARLPSLTKLNVAVDDEPIPT